MTSDHTHTGSFTGSVRSGGLDQVAGDYAERGGHDHVTAVDPAHKEHVADQLTTSEHVTAPRQAISQPQQPHEAASLTDHTHQGQVTTAPPINGVGPDHVTKGRAYDSGQKPATTGLVTSDYTHSGSVTKTNQKSGLNHVARDHAQHGGPVHVTTVDKANKEHVTTTSREISHKGSATSRDHGKQEDRVISDHAHKGLVTSGPPVNAGRSDHVTVGHTHKHVSLDHSVSFANEVENGALRHVANDHAQHSGSDYDHAHKQRLTNQPATSEHVTTPRRAVSEPQQRDQPQADGLRFTDHAHKDHVTSGPPVAAGSPHRVTKDRVHHGGKNRAPTEQISNHPPRASNFQNVGQDYVAGDHAQHGRPDYITNIDHAHKAHVTNQLASSEHVTTAKREISQSQKSDPPEVGLVVVFVEHLSRFINITNFTCYK